MINRAFFFTGAGLALALVGCAPDQGEDQSTPRLPGTFELAKAKQTNNEAEAPAIVDLSVDEVAALIERGNVRLIDVRRDDEVALGMIAGAEHIALDQFDPAKLDLSDGREVVLYCRSGGRSAVAAERLAKYTGKPVKHLQGGYLAWSEERSAD